MEGLKHNADVPAAEARQPVFAELLQIFAGDHDRAGVGPLQPGHHHQQRRFARSGRPQHANGLATAYMEVDVAQDMDAGGPAAERQIDAGKRDDVVGERVPGHVVHRRLIWVAAALLPNHRTW